MVAPWWAVGTCATVLALMRSVDSELSLSGTCIFGTGTPSSRMLRGITGLLGGLDVGQRYLTPMFRMEGLLCGPTPTRQCWRRQPQPHKPQHRTQTETCPAAAGRTTAKPGASPFLSIPMTLLTRGCQAINPPSLREPKRLLLGPRQGLPLPSIIPMNTRLPAPANIVSGGLHSKGRVPFQWHHHVSPAPIFREQPIWNVFGANGCN